MTILLLLPDFYFLAWKGMNLILLHLCIACFLKAEVCNEFASRFGNKSICFRVIYELDDWKNVVGWMDGWSVGWLDEFMIKR